MSTHPANDAKREHGAYDPESPRFCDNVFDFCELFLLTLAAVLVLTLFFFRYSVVDGGSMQTTLENGDRLIISDFFYTPKRGDVIVFEDYSIGEKEQKPLVKRVIALAGDTVSIATEGRTVDGVYRTVGVVYVNGEAIDEPYAFYDNRSDGIFLPEITVPEGKLFVLGDHRTVSLDSRYFGCISEDAVLGKVLLRVLPFSDFGTIE